VTKIPRADVIGSLLRPAHLIEARAEWRQGNLNDGALQAVTERAIIEAVALQEAAGLDTVTDGEFRRTNFIATMGVREAEYGSLSGFETVQADAGWLRLWKNPDGSPGGLITENTGPRSLVTVKIGVRRDIVAEEFPFLVGQAKKARPKYTFPAPSWHRAGWEAEHSAGAYPNCRDFLLDSRDYIRGVVEQLINEGCEYIHLDAPNYAQWHLDDGIRAKFKSWGRDLDAELIEDAEIDNSVFDGITGITRALHLCRGNAPDGRFLADGGYGRIAADLFPRLTNFDCLLLEYDTARAGNFTPLDKVRDDTVVVLGLITTKDGRLEDGDVIEARIRQAANFVPLERLALSPQCGFASGEYATTMTHAEQEAKLRLVGDIARRVWPNG
jgi:5-methyltetrahydropteroyltriglutamate--homocysteine methyltransferase